MNSSLLVKREASSHNISSWRLSLSSHPLRITNSQRLCSCKIDSPTFFIQRRFQWAERGKEPPNIKKDVESGASSLPPPKKIGLIFCSISCAVALSLGNFTEETTPAIFLPFCHPKKICWGSREGKKERIIHASMRAFLPLLKVYLGKKWKRSHH